jgi:hypothetical protein
MSSYAFAQDVSVDDVTVAASFDDAAAANNYSTAVGDYKDYSTSLAVDGIAVAESVLSGTVSKNFNAVLGAIVVADSGDNHLHDGAVTNFSGIVAVSQNTGNAALTQQSVVVQANVN